MMLSPVADLVRRYDRDRYLTALFAPADRRDALMALYAFNHEVAKTRESVTEPMLGRIRLQWWREGLDAAYGTGPVRQHEVMVPLADAIRRFGLTRDEFERLIDARELDLEAEPPATVAALEAYCADSSGRLQALALEVLGVRDAEAMAAAREVGTAYALTGLLRAIPFHARARRLYIPADLSREVGLDVAALFEFEPTPALALATAARRLAAGAHAHLSAARARARSIPAAALPALLPARLASVYLRALERGGFDVFDPRLALPRGGNSLRLAWAALIRRY
jgi:NADH dehydrogenase [ubiquinone] 1 alpha subcomplex assembly factor 6